MEHDHYLKIYQEYPAAADPVFLALREKYFDKKKNWLRADRILFAPTEGRMGPFHVRMLLPALGWEFRSTTEHVPLDDSAWSAVLDILDARRDWDLVQVPCLGANEVRALEVELGRRGRNVHVQDFPVCAIFGPKNYESYLKTRSSKKNKSQRKSLERILKVGCRIVEDVPSADLERLWNSRNAKHLLGNDEYTRSEDFRSFFHEFRSSLKRENRCVEIGIYAPNGTLIGYDFGFWVGRLFHSYQTAYHPEYRELRPGSVAFEYSLMKVMETDTDLLETMGNSGYHAEFAPNLINLKRVSFYSTGLKGRILEAVSKMKRRGGNE